MASGIGCGYRILVSSNRCPLALDNLLHQNTALTPSDSQEEIKTYGWKMNALKMANIGTRVRLKI